MKHKEWILDEKYKQAEAKIDFQIALRLIIVALAILCLVVDWRMFVAEFNYLKTILF